MADASRLPETLGNDNEATTGFLDDLLGGIFGDENNDEDDKKQQTKQIIIETKNDDSGSSRMNEMMLQNIPVQEEEEEPSVGENDEDEFRMGSLQSELDRRNNNNNLESPSTSVVLTEEKEEEFDGYAMRDVIYEKWGACFDVDFQRVDAFGMRELYLNVLPFRLGSRRFRHDTELDYLCHLQAIVEILEKYDQLGYVLMQIDETKKKPRGNTSPLVAVPLRLDLTPEQSNSILGYRD
eukprot:CAMPEP_0198293482 /NCGR_PEP_ID=MMETSP1449-20131203/17342_1 /TAXON_ID=420275 /ORGANISM="Attheya septentrionalis, Strain CCMP2084" /LENGTH=237 /DNA_ID=CAMNT_0043993073 /DNA_START=244 /DNA_END=958 /DNA_ORIENTATION=+